MYVSARCGRVRWWCEAMRCVKARRLAGLFVCTAFGRNEKKGTKNDIMEGGGRRESATERDQCWPTRLLLPLHFLLFVLSFRFSRLVHSAPPPPLPPPNCHFHCFASVFCFPQGQHFPSFTCGFPSVVAFPPRLCHFPNRVVFHSRFLQ